MTDFIFDPRVVSPHRSAADIAHYDRSAVDSLIEKAFTDLLTDDEREVIQAVRKSKVPIKKIIEHLGKLK